MIQNTSMVVTLSIKKWSARKHDRKITDEVRENHHASRDAGRYNKLLASKKFMEDVQKAESEARTYHYDNTLPWGENGERLLAAANYMDYVAAMMKFKSKYEQAVDGFYNVYDDVLEDAKQRLNGMFNPADYPLKEHVLSKFEFKTSFIPVPENDFRIKLADDEIANLRQNLETEINTRMQNAVKDIWSRIKEQLSKMQDRLTKTEFDEKTNEWKPVVFRDSLFDNLKDLINLLPKLNITNDPAINDACVEMCKILVDPNKVRTNASLRNEKAEQVTEVLNKFNSFFN